MIEFALVLPLFLFILFYIMELSLIGFSMVMVENGMSSALRAAKVGKTSSGMSREDLIRNTIKEQSFGLVAPERLTLTNYISSFGSSVNVGPGLCFKNGTGYTGQVCPCAGAFEDRNNNGICDEDQADLNIGYPGEVVLYTAIYRYKPILPFMDELFASNSAHELLLVTGGAARNE